MSIAIDNPPRRIALITDFGAGPYVGQVLLRLAASAPDVAVVSLIADLTPWRPDLAAYLLPGLTQAMPTGTAYLCVVDPGVGTERAVLVAQIRQDWFLAPDNGLLVPLLRRSPEARVWRLDWRPERLSASFHGRDLFAPLAARVVAGALPDSTPIDPQALCGASWPDALAAVCYVDDFGNLMTGLPADGLAPTATLRAGGWRIGSARTFAEVAPGQPFWYRNAFDLVEIAVNQGRACDLLQLGAGDPVAVEGEGPNLR